MNKLTPTNKGRFVARSSAFCAQLKADEAKYKANKMPEGKIAASLAEDIAQTLLQGGSNPNPSEAEVAQFRADYAHEVADIFSNCLGKQLVLHPNLPDTKPDAKPDVKP